MATPVRALSESDALTILSGQSLSDALDLKGRILTGVFLPAAWTAANLTFQASPDGGTYYDAWDQALEITVSAAASRFVAIDAQLFLGVRFLKVRSGTSGTPVAQGADRALILMTGAPSV